VIFQIVLFSFLKIGFFGVNLLLVFFVIRYLLGNEFDSLVMALFGALLIEYLSGFIYGSWIIGIVVVFIFLFFTKKRIPKITGFSFLLFLIFSTLIFDFVNILYLRMIIGSFNSVWIWQYLIGFIINLVFGYSVFLIYRKYFHKKVELNIGFNER
jgi:hypothetical protein